MEDGVEKQLVMYTWCSNTRFLVVNSLPSVPMDTIRRQSTSRKKALVPLHDKKRIGVGGGKRRTETLDQKVGSRIRVSFSTLEKKKKNPG